MRTVQLHGVRAAGRLALVDDGDYELVSQYRWNLKWRKRPGQSDDGPYAIAYAKGRNAKIQMHTLITGYVLTDHINHDGLDNRRANLRSATFSQNNANARPRAGSSLYKGVSWKSSSRKWKAAIQCARATHYLGLFASEIDAARAYDAAAREFFGDYAYLNFPEQLEVAPS